MNPIYSIFIPTINKDFNKLDFILKSIDENLSGYNEIIIVAPDLEVVNWVSQDLQYLFRDRLRFFKESDVLNLDKEACQYRPGWQYQQFLKMFQNVTKNDMYLTVDSDVIFNKPISFYEDDKIICYRGWEQHHEPYFVYQTRLFDLPRIFPHTGICDLNFFNKIIWREFLERYAYTPETLWKKTCEITNEYCRAAEPEIHVQYIHKFHWDKYVFKELKTYSEGRVILNPNTRPWSNSDYEDIIRRGKESGADLTMGHSWFG